MPDTAFTIARRFAGALDTEDYATARALLAEVCVYNTGKGELVGIEPIVESYAANGDKARQRFDDIEYGSSVDPFGHAGAIITFTDRVRIGDACHEYRCRQHVSVNEAGLIHEIVHEEIPGGRDELNEFEQTQRQRHEQLQEVWRAIVSELSRARATLPSDSDADLAVQQHHDFLDHNELELACDSLEKYAEDRPVPREFWLALADAAQKMSLHDRAAAYRAYASQAQPFQGA